MDIQTYDQAEHQLNQVVDTIKSKTNQMTIITVPFWFAIGYCAVKGLFIPAAIAAIVFFVIYDSHKKAIAELEEKRQSLNQQAWKLGIDENIL